MRRAPLPPARRPHPGLSAALLAAVLGGLLWAVFGAPAELFDTGAWARQAARLLAWQQQAPALFLAGFMLLFVLLSALALPGCGALALLAGSAFGTLAGTLLVGLASTLGALLSFLAARHWARDRVQRRLGHRLLRLDALLARHGALGLIGLRLLPVLPYPVVNPLLGVSRMSVPAFFWPSLAGLTLGSLPYVWAGQSLQALLQGLPGKHLLWLALACSLLLAAALAVRQRRAAEAAR
ncbi:MAG: VTT domain-containing protein [Burkholderiaceae bacterium]|nr:VTT domain-containing protein [Burkholderiaceae bacterium]